MNLIRKPIKVEINGEELEMILDFESAIEFEGYYGESIFVGIDKIIKEQNLKALGCLIASCVKRDGKPVGMSFLAGMDVVGGVTYFSERIVALMENSLPEEDDKDKQKKTSQTEN